jgi:hypothetical protein
VGGAAASDASTCGRDTHDVSPRAASVCSQPGCPHVAVRRGRCELHAPPPWAGSQQARDRRGVLRGHALQRERRRAIGRVGGRCQDCGQPGPQLVLHHLTRDLADYEHVLVLCPRCHDARHGRSH